MLKKHILSSIILFCFSFYGYSQLCEGSLGDPIVEIDFGSGTGRGSELGSDITAFNYVGTGTLDEGEYTIFNTTSGLKENPWHITTDHTGDANGYMMVINSAVLANEGVFYTKSVNSLCADTTYEFSAWVMNIMNPANGTDEHNPNITFRVSDTAGTILGSYNTGNIAQTSSATWIQYGFFFTLDSDTEVVITILNSASSGRGNDIVLDDIAFKPCGPTIINSIDGNSLETISACEDGIINYTLETTVSAGYSDPQFQWQHSDDNGNTWLDITGETTTDLTITDTSTPGTFLYRLAAANGNNINSNSCRITSDVFTIEITEKPNPLVGDAQQSFCSTQNATLENIAVNASAVWYDSLTKDNILPETTTLINGKTYYATQINNGCESDDVLAVEITIYTPTLAFNHVETFVCDNLNDGTEVVDLSFYEDQITTCTDCEFSYFNSENDAQNYSESGQVSSPSDYLLNTPNTIVYVRIDSQDNCYQIAELILNLQETPTININDSIGICESDNDITIDAGFGYDSYLWSTGETTQTIIVTTEDIGDYSITVTQNHGSYTCSSQPKEFEVTLSNAAIIENIAIDDWTDNENAITIILSNLSLGEYEYSLDNISYQDDNTFSQLTYGEHTVYIRDKNGCGITQEPFYILNSPKYFTPNNDGYHDTWSIKHSEIVEPTMTVNIYDRYGKLIKFLDASSSWDGTFNGSNLPTSDYWFIVTREDGRIHKGHFTLKR